MTGCTQAAAQVRWFTSRGMRAELRLKPTRKCIVLREWLTAGQPAKAEPRWEKLSA